MLYEVSSRRTVIDKRGNDKTVTEHFLVYNAQLFSEAETAVLLEYNMENDVVSIKRSAIREVINERTDEEDRIYLATLEFTDEDESTSKTVVAIFATSITCATNLALRHASSFVSDACLIGVRKSRFIDYIKYLG